MSSDPANTHQGQQPEHPAMHKQAGYKTATVSRRAKLSTTRLPHGRRPYKRIMDFMSIAQLLGNLGEFVGAIAVVVTLGFLVHQLRQNTRALDESSRLALINQADESYRDISRWRGMVTNDSELTEIWHRGTAGEELSDVDAERFMQLAYELIFGCWRGYEGAMNVGNDGYAEELIESLAGYGRMPVIGATIRFLAVDGSVFAPYLSRVIPRIDESDHSEMSGARAYKEIRASLGQGA